MFPSIHCLVSWLCYAGLRGRKDVPDWYRRVSLVLAVMVCISTLLTKQHVIADVFGGILLAEACLWAGRETALGTFYKKLMNRVNRAVFREKQHGAR